MATKQNEILQRISNLCEKKNWSLYRLAKESNIPYSSLNTMFIRNTQPTIPTLEKICAGLNLTLSEFFNNDNIDNPYFYVLTDDEKKIINSLRLLPEQKQELVIAYIKGLSAGISDN
ncbi:MAG: helix-turn-helix transcriptional regulator [Lachnospiraceae bacterium]|nr:helix-turn-helix transcriptional regulator [Lachnospiraceae bacterium]